MGRIRHFEQQADRVARAVVQGRPLPFSAVDSARSDDTERVGPGVARAVRAATRSGGRRLPERVRSSMEGAVPADLDAVRVHTDGEADTLSRLLAARAFTTGNDIFFRRGEPDFTTSAGKELLVHELTHVAQQQSAPTAPGSGIQRKPVWEKAKKRWIDDELGNVELQTTADEKDEKKGWGKRYKVR